MSKRDKDKVSGSELRLAAEGLDEELETFERLVDAVKKHPLSSQKHLERMAGALTEAAESDKRLEAAVRSLAEAILAARARQQAQAEVVQARALVLQQRTEDFVGLQRSFEALGVSAADLTMRMKAVASRMANDAAAGEPTAEDNAGAPGLLELVGRMGEIADDARRLVEAAKEKDFPDIAQQAEALRQQLMSAKNKLSLLERGTTRLA